MCFIPGNNADTENTGLHTTVCQSLPNMSTRTELLEQLWCILSYWPYCFQYPLHCSPWLARQTLVLTCKPNSFALVKENGRQYYILVAENAKCYSATTSSSNCGCKNRGCQMLRLSSPVRQICDLKWSRQWPCKSILYWSITIANNKSCLGIAVS